MFWWRGWSSGNDLGADVFSGFCIPFFRRSFRYRYSKFSFFFAVQPLIFRCSSMSFPTMSTRCFDDEIEAHEMVLALTWLWFEVFFCFACQSLIFRCSSLSSSTLSTLYLDDEVEAHRVIWADFLWILHSQFLISFANRDRNFRCFARQLLAFRCPSMCFPTMSAWCFDDEVEAQEMILALTCLVAFVSLFSEKLSLSLFEAFVFFCCSAFDFSMFLNVFSNIVNVMFWWRDWSSWNDFGSDVFMVWDFFVLLVNRWFFDVPLCLSEHRQRDN